MPGRASPTFGSVVRIVGSDDRFDAKMYDWYIASSSGEVDRCEELERLVYPELAANTPDEDATFRLSLPVRGRDRVIVDAYIRSAWMICLKAVRAGDATYSTAARAMNMVRQRIVRIEDFFWRLVGVEEIREGGMPSIPVASSAGKDGDAKIPRAAILIVAENGLTESEAAEAIEAALTRGELKRSTLDDPGSILYRQGDDRRYILNRVLNSLAMKRISEMSCMRIGESGPGDPLVDVLTGRPAGV